MSRRPEKVKEEPKEATNCNSSTSSTPQQPSTSTQTQSDQNRSRSSAREERNRNRSRVRFESNNRDQSEPRRERSRDPRQSQNSNENEQQTGNATGSRLNELLSNFLESGGSFCGSIRGEIIFCNHPEAAEGPSIFVFGDVDTESTEEDLFTQSQ